MKINLLDLMKKRISLLNVQVQPSLSGCKSLIMCVNIDQQVDERVHISRSSIGS